MNEAVSRNLRGEKSRQRSYISAQLETEQPGVQWLEAESW
jgi:hypothetical protein